MIDFKNDDTLMLLCAFRYALGRRTYIVSTVVDLVLHNWDNIPEYDKTLMKKEINEHKRMHGNIGDTMDEREWDKISVKDV